MATNRRTFLAGTLAGSAALGLNSQVPTLLANVGQAARKQDNILVVVQLSGGNDGLNTVIPHGDDLYHQARPKLGFRTPDVLKIDDYHGFHPELTGFQNLLDQQQLTVVQGVGYKNPNRSHFESMDIWHTCFREQDRQQDGWLGRSLAQMSDQHKGEIPALHLGGVQQPLALKSRDLLVPSIQSIDQFRFQGKPAVEELKTATHAMRAESNDLLSFVQDSTMTAINVSEKFEAGAKTADRNADYPASKFADKLKTIADLIGSGLSTRVYYVTLGGFDTHAQQPAAHAALLKELGDGLAAFMSDLAEQSQTDRVLTMVFSEFGRRVQENASSGTDHGTAAPVFLAGGRVAPGLSGKQPSLKDLDQGDLKYHTDFRSLYAGVLEHWLNLPNEKILGDRYEPIKFLQT